VNFEVAFHNLEGWGLVTLKKINLKVLVLGHPSWDDSTEAYRDVILSETFIAIIINTND
jgi:hypothetical protein